MILSRRGKERESKRKDCRKEKPKVSFRIAQHTYNKRCKNDMPYIYPFLISYRDPRLHLLNSHNRNPGMSVSLNTLQTIELFFEITV